MTRRWGAVLALTALLGGCATLTARITPAPRPSALAHAYPDQVWGVRGGQLVMADGTRFPIS